MVHMWPDPNPAPMDAPSDTDEPVIGGLEPSSLRFRAMCAEKFLLIQDPFSEDPHRAVPYAFILMPGEYGSRSRTHERPR